jgi:hypothetical protein
VPRSDRLVPGLHDPLRFIARLARCSVLLVEELRIHYPTASFSAASH